MRSKEAEEKGESRGRSVGTAGILATYPEIAGVRLKVARVAARIATTTERVKVKIQKEP